MDIINHPAVFPAVVLVFVLYLIFSKLKKRLNSELKCQYCKKGKMQVTKLVPTSVSYMPHGGYGGGGGKSSVLTKVTYKCSYCPEFFIVNESR